MSLNGLCQHSAFGSVGVLNLRLLTCYYCFACLQNLLLPQYFLCLHSHQLAVCRIWEPIQVHSLLLFLELEPQSNHGWVHLNHKNSPVPVHVTSNTVPRDITRLLPGDRAAYDLIFLLSLFPWSILDLSKGIKQFN